jgi:DNA-binding XRE family transcriptional regulator
MSNNKTSDATAILRDQISRDSELAALVEEERHRLQLAEKIRSARREAGLTQTEVAKQIGTTQSAIARLESGGYERLSIRTLLKVAAVLNCRLDVDMVRVD